MVLSTDGKTSFAALLYSQFTVDLISSPCNRLPFLIGFTAGDGRRFTNIPNVLNKINVFRIDGMYVCTFFHEYQSFIGRYITVTPI